MSHNYLGHDQDCLWTPADWAWIGGLFDVLMPGLALGIPVVASKMQKFSPKDTLIIISRGKVRNVFFPPTALRILKASDIKIVNLRSIACGGEPLGAEMLEWGKKNLKITINEFYGQTECNMVVTSCNADREPISGLMGAPVPGHEVNILDSDGFPTNDEGEISIKRGSASMMLEYWRRPDQTEEKFKGDWLLTGDRGRFHAGGIEFIGRDDDVINSAGYRIGPSEIEDCLLMHPAVATVGVVGKPDHARNEIVKAYVVIKAGHKADYHLSEALQEFVKTRLAKHLYPREISFLDELPMTVTGKVIRKKLREKSVLECK
jgi:acetyl-CoA synthetase